MISFHAVDFPSAVVVTGQIRYTMFIKAASARLTLRGLVAFSGMATVRMFDGTSISGPTGATGPIGPTGP
ncbi:hypothetical protein [Priestia sp. YIM B13486]|uniref:hypothetical protein n=1 Tax=Priestia sp. YIM B13486 TaxID=3366304 RepID=UPI003673281B